MQLHRIALAAVIGPPLFVTPGIALAMSCQQMCTDFMPKNSAASPSTYDCEDQINDNGGNCTIRGRANTTRDVPSLGVYKHGQNVTAVTRHEGGRTYRAYD